MEKSLGVNGLTHPCYVFYQRMNFCINKESFYTRMCLEEIEDWVECKSRTKHVYIYILYIYIFDKL